MDHTRISLLSLYSLCGVLAPAWSQDLFGLSASSSFTLNDVALPTLRLVDSLALTNTGCVRYASWTDSTASIFNVFTNEISNPDQGLVVCASYAGETLSWTAQSGVELLGVQEFTFNPIHYGSLIVLDSGSVGYILHETNRILAVHRNGTIQHLLSTNVDPLLGLYTDPESKLAYLALDNQGFYFGFPLDLSRASLRIASQESIFIGGNLLNSRPQILTLSNEIHAHTPSGFVQLQSNFLFPLLTREVIVLASSQTLSIQPVFTVPVIVSPGSSIQLDPRIQTFFQDLQIGAGSVLVLDLGGAAYGSGDTLNIFNYASATGQFSQIVLLNYASSSCLVLSADGQFTGTSFYVTFSTDLSCTPSLALRLVGF